MTPEERGERVTEEDAFAFILEQIDSVPHLEALLLLWSSTPHRWTALEMAGRLYVPEYRARQVIEDLLRRGLAAAQNDTFAFEARSPRDNLLVQCVAEVYRTQLVRVSSMIHSKASASVREFAKAFKFTKDPQ